MGQIQTKKHIKSNLLVLTIIVLGLSYPSQELFAKGKKESSIKAKYKRELGQLRQYSRLFNAIHNKEVIT